MEFGLGWEGKWLLWCCCWRYRRVKVSPQIDIHQGKDIARKAACCLADIYLSSADSGVDGIEGLGG
jgi:hypothetical protein